MCILLGVAVFSDKHHTTIEQVNKEKCVETSLSSLPIPNQINIFLYRSPSITS